MLLANARAKHADISGILAVKKEKRANPHQQMRFERQKSAQGFVGEKQQQLSQVDEEKKGTGDVAEEEEAKQIEMMTTI